MMEVFVQVQSLEARKNALRVVVEAADGFIQVVVFAVVAGQVFRLEEGRNSIAHGEALAGRADQRFTALVADHVQRFAGKGALQQGDSLLAVQPRICV